MQNRNVFFIVFLIFILCILCYCIKRDIQVEKQYPGDLRNRIVGARLQMDGKLPYFFRWNSPADDRYYDPDNFGFQKVSNITASPFLHQLLFPIANFQQRTISKIWLLLEYLFVLGIPIFSIIYFAKNNTQKAAVLITTVLLLLTFGWKMHIGNGQYYILISFLAMLFYAFVLKYTNNFCLICAAILAVCLLLLRPNLAFYLLPFLFIFLQFTSSKKLIFTAAFLLPLLIYFSIPQNRILWENYELALKEQVKIHQNLPTILQQNPASPNYVYFEGWDFNEAKNVKSAVPDTAYRENANVFVLIKSKLHYKMPIWQMTVLPFIIAAFFLLIFWKKNNNKNNKTFDSTSIAILGFCLYMLSELLSPVHRFEYNFVQWTFPLLLLAANFNIKYWKIYVLVLIGLLLNIIEIKRIYSEHSFGEYMILFGLLFYALSNKNINYSEAIN